jgi:hypothetical protein
MGNYTEIALRREEKIAENYSADTGARIRLGSCGRSRMRTYVTLSISA